MANVTSWSHSSLSLASVGRAGSFGSTWTSVLSRYTVSMNLSRVAHHASRSPVVGGVLFCASITDSHASTEPWPGKISGIVRKNQSISVCHSFVGAIGHENDRICRPCHASLK